MSCYTVYGVCNMEEGEAFVFGLHCSKLNDYLEAYRRRVLYEIFSEKLIYLQINVWKLSLNVKLNILVQYMQSLNFRYKRKRESDISHFHMQPFDVLTYTYTYCLWGSIWYGDFIDYGCCKSECSRKAAWQNKYNNGSTWALSLVKKHLYSLYCVLIRLCFYVAHQMFKTIDTVTLKLCEGKFVRMAWQHICCHAILKNYFTNSLNI
jgi:hypothetical protein